MVSEIKNKLFWTHYLNADIYLKQIKMLQHQKIILILLGELEDYIFSGATVFMLQLTMLKLNFHILRNGTCVFLLTLFKILKLFSIFHPSVAH